MDKREATKVKHRQASLRQAPFTGSGQRQGTACGATRRDGAPCQARPTRSGFCLAHDPDLAEKRRLARKQGGLNKSKVVRLGKLVPPRLMPVFDRLEAALAEVHSGEIPPGVASAMASLAGAMVRVLTSGELEERVRALEEREER